MEPATWSLAGGLAVLALVDSTSVGTLGLPAWMLARPKIRPLTIVSYLVAISGFYWVLGIALFAGLLTLAPVISEVADSVVTAWVQLVVGVGLFLASFLLDGPIGRRRRDLRAARRTETRSERWRASIAGPAARPAAAIGVALAAGVVEAATMVPFLTAIGLLTASDVGLGSGVAILAAYVLVMIVPALVLLVLRLVLTRSVEPVLGMLSGWFDRHAGDLLAWALGIVGFLLAFDAVGRL